MIINIFNLQSALKIYKNKIKKQIKMVLEGEKVDTELLNVYFISKKAMQALHKELFNDDSQTDCIAVPIDSPKEKSPISVLGEIFVCPEVAIEYARSLGLDPYEENRLYVIHALLHLLGYNDLTEKELSIMQEKEKIYQSKLI